MDNENKIYSIVLRVRRVIHEDAYISVPATMEIMKENDNGSFGIDFEKFVVEAINLSKHSNVDWQIETSYVETHPVQSPKPEERQSFYPTNDQ